MVLIVRPPLIRTRLACAGAVMDVYEEASPRLRQAHRLMFEVTQVCGDESAIERCAREVAS
jgi:hypothetical protein